LPSRDSCNQSAQKSLDEEKVNELRDVFAEANQSVGSQVVASDLYQNALSKWSTCMADRGFHYSGIRDAEQAGAVLRGSGTAPARAALDVAIADIACEHEVKLIELTHSQMADAVAKWIDANQQTVDDYNGAVALLDSRAQAILAGS
jgi:hypothetical protein